MIGMGVPYRCRIIAMFCDYNVTSAKHILTISLLNAKRGHMVFHISPYQAKKQPGLHHVF